MEPHEDGREEGKLYQDPMYGAKVLSPLAVAIMDTAEFQRLSDLRQLGFADLVYRGARHTRLSHSVGTYFVCRTICRRILQNHERMRLEHPGSFVSKKFRLAPPNSTPLSDETCSGQAACQAQWRGLTEVVSAAALLHDIGHVPFGHTLEDEYTGLFERHDNLAGPRLHTMLFNEQSQLRQVFADGGGRKRWIPELTNSELAQLIYVILNWKEDVRKRYNFETLLNEEEEKRKKAQNAGGEKIDESRKAALERLEELKRWHIREAREELFAPFMSDIIGNTMCADLLDYLPRDRLHLGMEPRYHRRLHRYFVVRQGTHYEEEGRRLTIMVERRGRGGQRVDVATAVLSIMRERYEMAERVFYHHKKAAASAMLAQLFELVKDDYRPRDDDQIYPMLWDKPDMRAPHMVHLSDSGLIDHLGKSDVEKQEHRELQRRLYSALRAKRSEMYRTLLVIDGDLARSGNWGVERIAANLRSKDGKPSAEGRHALEAKLVAAAHAIARTERGDVLVYCPSPSMQSKEVDARLELKPDDVKPLSQQVDEFKYSRDVETLQRYYRALWRAYVFVSPDVFRDAARCRAIVDEVSDKYAFPKDATYRKVRGHRFDTNVVDLGLLRVRIDRFLKEEMPFLLEDSADGNSVIMELLGRAARDSVVTAVGGNNGGINEQLRVLIEVVALERLMKDAGEKEALIDRMGEVTRKPATAILNRQGGLLSSVFKTFKEYMAAVENESESERAAARGKKKPMAKSTMETEKRGAR